MLVVGGESKLKGRVKISGSKNATLPILGASLLVNGKMKLRNVPKIGDVMTFLSIMEELGAVYSFEGDTLSLDTSNLDKDKLNLEKIKKIRASILLLSPLLFFFGNISIPFPGGCKIGARPVDSHLNGLRAIGFDYSYTDSGDISLNGKLKDGDIVLNAGFGVTSTENLIVANVLRKGQTTIMSSAFEPHVMNVIEFLRTAGADIKIRYDHTIIINGVDKLTDEFEFDVISDYIEAGTFTIMGALASEEYIDIENARINDLYVFLEKLKEAGVKMEDMGDDVLRVYRSRDLKKVDIQTNLYPGFPTDLQSPFAVLQTQAEGISKIHEVLFEGRLNWLVELESMGADLQILNPHQAIIVGKAKLKGGKTVTSWDLRAGASMVIAGLIATGETRVDKVEYIFRGYENFVSKLENLGAKISLENN